MSAAQDEVQTLIADLRRRLDEAEETLRAIRDGEVDALVIRGGAEDEVFAIGDDAESFRKFIEAMDPGAAAVDGSGRVLYANAAMIELIGLPLTSIQGRPFADLFATEPADAIRTLLDQASETRASAEIVFEVGTGEMGVGERIHLVAATPVRLGTITGRAVTLTDMTERIRAERAEQAEQVSNAIIASANEAVVVCDPAGVVTHANAAAAAAFDRGLVGQGFDAALPLVLAEGCGFSRVEDLVAVAAAGTSVQGVEAVIRVGERPKDVLISAAPLRVALGQTVGCVLTLVDISQRRAAEKQQLLLLRELDHRVKNTLALVLSISNRTLSVEDTLEGFQQAFTARIQALAATHTLLAHKGWSDLQLSDIIMAEIAPYTDDEADRIELGGIDVSLTPRTAIAMGLIIHELTTNAVKYGALSTETGRISVRSMGRSRDRDSLMIEWLETGGPHVERPVRSGFGRTVISRSLSYSPNGGADLQFPPSGVRCVIDIPGEEIVV